MKKKLNTDSIMNELKGGSGFFPGRQSAEAPSQMVEEPSGQLTNQSTSRPTGQSTNKAVSQPTNKQDASPILGRPKAFYITQKQDELLDDVVKSLSKALEGKINQKIDRSTVVRLLIEEANLQSKETVSRLSSRLINRLISQLTS